MILVTGGAGFIGSRLVSALIHQKKEVIILDNLTSSSKNDVPKIANLVVGDIRNSPLVDDLMAKVHQCFHLAALIDVKSCEYSSQECIDVNVYGSQNIFNSAAKHRVKVVYASSAAVYGESTPGKKNSEKNATSPKSIYGLSKLFMENLATYYSQNFNLKAIGLRFFNVYGYPFAKASPYSGVIRSFLESVSEGKAITIFGDGNQKRDFVHLDDIVKTCTSIMDQPRVKFDILNVGTSQETSIKALAEMIIAMAQKPLALQYKEYSPFDISYSCSDISRLRGILPDYDPIDIKFGLEVMLKERENETK